MLTSLPSPHSHSLPFLQCCYVCLCPCCAAGDVASAVKMQPTTEDVCHRCLADTVGCECIPHFWMSCCVAPMLCCHSCWWYKMRENLAVEYGINDDQHDCCPGKKFPLMLLPCTCHCLLIQEVRGPLAVRSTRRSPAQGLFVGRLGWQLTAFLAPTPLLPSLSLVLAAQSHQGCSAAGRPGGSASAEDHVAQVERRTVSVILPSLLSVFHAQLPLGSSSREGLQLLLLCCKHTGLAA